MDDMFKHVVEILEISGYDSLNDNFDETEEMYFQNYETGDFFGLRIIDFEIFMSEDDTLRSYQHVGDLDTFEKYVSLGSEGGDGELSDYQNRHLDSIAGELKNTKEEEDEEDYEMTYSGDEDFTDNQNDAFRKLVKNNKELIEQVMEEIRVKNLFEVKPDTWLALEKAMIDTKLVVDYGDYGINPDDFIDWLGENWEESIDIMFGDKEIETKEKPTLSKQDEIFYDIALNQDKEQIKLFIKQVIDKDHVVTKDQYDKYQKSVETWIKRKYNKELNNNNKEINHRTFIDWLKKHKRDLLEYYK